MDNTNNGVSIIANACLKALESIITSTDSGYSKLLLIIYNSSKSKNYFTRLSGIKCFKLVLINWTNFNHENHFQSYSKYLVSSLNDSNQICRNEGIECYKSLLKLFPNKMKVIYDECNNRVIQKKLDSFGKLLEIENKSIDNNQYNNNKPKQIIKNKPTVTIAKKNIIKKENISVVKEEICKSSTSSLTIKTENETSSFTIGKKLFKNLKTLGKAKRVNTSKTNILFKRKTINENEKKSKRICLSDITNK